MAARLVVRVTRAGLYTPYEAIVAEAAQDAGLDARLADELGARWPELRPWPEALAVLAQAGEIPKVVVTNCSQRLAEVAAAATGWRFDAVISAERAGVYKTDRRAYEAGLGALGLPGSAELFVAGSAHDVPGAGAAGMDVYWSNWQGLAVPPGPLPVADEPDLHAIPRLLDIGG